jgi:predicted amidohydrolase YtcJ
MAARLTAFLVVGIVAVTLIAGLMVGAQRDDNEGPVDLIVHNATLYTADDDESVAEAVAIRGNQILRVGSNREIARLQRPQTTMIDAKGAAVVPGFNDAHVRLMEGALSLAQADLLGAADVHEIQARVTAWAAANPEAAWVVGRGWTAQALAGSAPTRQLLDAAVEDRPVYLIAADGRQAWVNTAALKQAGITRRTADPAGGTIEKDAATGDPTGLLTGAAANLVSGSLPSLDRDARIAALRTAVKEAHALGITSVQDIGASPADIALYDELRKEGALDLRIYASLAVREPVDEAVLARIESIWKRFSDDARLRTGAIALELDPDAEEADAGPKADTPREPRIPPDDLNRFVRLLDRGGWQVTANARTEQAVRLALNAYVHAARSNTAPERGRRHRVEGADEAGDPDIPRFRTTGTLASVQPLLGDDEADAVARLAGARTRLALGSGWPEASLNPMLGLHRAVTAATPLPLESAITAYTAGGAYASFDEQRKGTITAGMLADIVVLSHDIFETAPERIAGASVAVTIFDGKVVYRRDSKSSN